MVQHAVKAVKEQKKKTSPRNSAFKYIAIWSCLSISPLLRDFQNVYLKPSIKQLVFSATKEGATQTQDANLYQVFSSLFHEVFWDLPDNYVNFLPPIFFFLQL